MTNTKDALGDRMKAYENAYTNTKALKGIPLLARLDGRAFHTFTKGLNRPYDPRMSKCMIETTKFLVEETNALVGFVQSDEISLVWFVPPDSVSDYIFGGRIQKITSVLAGMASAKFMKLVMEHIPEKNDTVPSFDCRVWQVPSLDVAADAFLWRELDATKNSISMAAHVYFSNAELHKKTGSQKQEMLFSDHGINWNDYPPMFKRGVYVQRKKFMRDIPEDILIKIPEKHRINMGKVERSIVMVLDLPPAQKIKNYKEVLFNAEDPVGF